MRQVTTFDPSKLQTPNQVGAFKKFQNAKTKIRQVVETVMSQDNVDTVDLDPTPGRVTVHNYRAPSNEKLTGSVSENEVTLKSFRAEDVIDGYATVQTSYERSAENDFSITKDTRGEFAYGRNSGVGYKRHLGEAAQMNQDGTITYTESSKRTSRSVGEF